GGVERASACLGRGAGGEVFHGGDVVAELKLQPAPGPSQRRLAVFHGGDVVAELKLPLDDLGPAAIEVFHGGDVVAELKLPRRYGSAIASWRFPRARARGRSAANSTPPRAPRDV